MPHDEGRIVVTSSGSTLSYNDHWFVRDHLGSVRAVVDITSYSTSLQDIVIEQNDYLPFGTRVPIKTSSSNLYRYNGKEEQQIAGTELAVLDYGARTYDPWLSRWTSIDPLAAKYYSTSPYVFCNNSPVNYVDPWGMDIWEMNRKGEIKWSESSDEHRLYAIDSENNRSIDYIIVKNPDIDDFFKVFLFAADNSDVEWSLHRMKL